MADTPNEITELDLNRRVRVTENGAECIRTYRINNTDPEAIYGLGVLPAYNTAHPTLPGLYVSDVEVKVPRKNARFALIQIKYTTPSWALTPNLEDWNWDLVSRTEHITAVENSSYCTHFPSGADVGTAIGWNGEEAEGVDVYRPYGVLTVTKVWTSISEDGRNVLEAMAAHMNLYAWHGYGVGELLFLGPVIDRMPDGRILVTYKFLTARRRAPFYVTLLDGSTTLVDLVPWNYLWFEHGEEVIDNGDEKVRQRGIKSAHIAQVYDYADFSVFGLVGPYG